MRRTESGNGRSTERERLRVLSVAAPLAGLLALYLIREVLLHLGPPLLANVLTAILACAGIFLFSWAVFRTIGRQDERLAEQHGELERRYATERRLRAQLETLHQAALAIASTRTPATILQCLVDLARELIGARYAALGVLGEHGAIDGFYTSGITAEERARLGPPPQGHGLLSVLLSEGAVLRVDDIARDPRAVGFPPGHPPMTSLLGVPVAHQAHIVGNLYLADKEGAPPATTGDADTDARPCPFSADDEHLLRLLASHAAVVIENARLAARVQTLAVAAERERIGQDLHDGVIQALYAVNLELEDAAEDVATDPEAVRERLDGVIDRLGEVMKEIRRYILGLHTQTEAAPAEEQPLAAALAALLADARAHALVETHLQLDGADEAREGLATVPPAVAREVLQIAREAVSNAVRHARASHLWLTCEVLDGAQGAGDVGEAGRSAGREVGGEVHLRVADNGRGFDPARAVPEGHYGLRNLRERARALGGTLAVQTLPGRGTAIDLRAPLVTPTGEREKEDVHV